MLAKCVINIISRYIRAHTIYRKSLILMFVKPNNAHENIYLLGQSQIRHCKRGKVHLLKFNFKYGMLVVPDRCGKDYLSMLKEEIFVCQAWDSWVGGSGESCRTD